MRGVVFGDGWGCRVAEAGVDPGGGEDDVGGEGGLDEVGDGESTLNSGVGECFQMTCNGFAQIFRLVKKSVGSGLVPSSFKSVSGSDSHAACSVRLIRYNADNKGRAHVRKKTPEFSVLIISKSPLSGPALVFDCYEAFLFAVNSRNVRDHDHPKKSFYDSK